MVRVLTALFVLLQISCATENLLAVMLYPPGSDLQEAISNAKPGDHIIIKDGEYRNVTLVLDVAGTAGAPILITPETRHGVIFSGKVRIIISGKHLNLTGLRFRDCLIDGSPLFEFEESEYCRVSAMIFEHSGGNRPVVEFRSGKRENIISGSCFTNIAGRSVHVQVNDSIFEHGIPVGNIIRDNVFMDIPSLGDNGRETVKIGQNQPEFGHIKTRTVVENNQFIRCNGESEIISNKASSNIYRHNTFIECDGEMVMRGGHNCLIELNQFVNCSGGIRLSGTGHTVRRNTIIQSKQTGIRLLYGMSQDQGGHYQAVRNCEISHNTIIDAGRMGIYIGDGRNKDWKEKGIQKYAPENNRFTNNLIVSDEGKYLFSNNAPNNLIQDNLCIPNKDYNLDSPIPISGLDSPALKIH